MKAGPGSSRQFGFDMIIIQHHAVITGLGDLIFVTELGTVT